MSNRKKIFDDFFILIKKNIYFPNNKELFEQNGHLVKLGIEWDDLGRSKVFLI